MLDRLSIRAKLIGAFAAGLALTLALGLFAINRVGAVRHVAVEMEIHWLPSLYQLGVLGLTVGDHRFNLMQHEAKLSEAETRQARTRMTTLSGDVAEIRAAYELLIASPEGRDLYNSFATRWDVYAREAAAVLDLSERGDEVAAKSRLQQQAIPAYRQMRTALDQLVELNVADGGAAGASGGRTYKLTLTLVLGLLTGAILLGTATAWIIIRGIGRGISAVVTPMRAMTQGDLEVTIPTLAPHTELGRIAQALQALRGSLLEGCRQSDEQAQLRTVQNARSQTIEGLVHTFEAEAAAALQVVASAATELDATAAAMQGTAQDGNEQASSLAAAAEQASANVQTVAASAKEMAASIAEVARQVTESARVARQATADARATDAAVGELSGAAGRIGEVVRLISGIAGQTNLLALNATIEAARAGEAGKGFAVVASEVKALASQTAKATEEIGAQVAAIQAETGRAVEAIRGIARTIDSLDGLTTQVAAAAEQQSAATREIGRAVAEAAAGTRDVSRHAGGVTQGAEQTGAAASQVRAASGELSQKAEGLRAQVDSFLAGIRAA